MSSAADQLCLNISTSLPLSSVSSRRRCCAQERWLQKRNKAKRRRSSSQEVIISINQRRLHTAEEEEPPASQKRNKAKKRRSSSSQDVNISTNQNRRHTAEEAEPPASQAPPLQQRDGRKSQQKSEKEAGMSSFKTSSLFKHNPDIPEFHSPVVSQVKEQIFSRNSFMDLDLHPHLVATLNKVLNVSTLTSVQKRTIPVLQAGRDAVVQSQTGSGKTLSYAVPVVQCLQSMEPKVSRSDGPLAVVIVPTRELALQTFQTFQKLLKPFMWIVPGVLMGGEKRKAEKARLRKGINILVSTPGRLVDHIKHTLSITFSAVHWLILDEADRTLDLGFEKDLTVILNSLNSSVPKRQNVLLSATLTNGKHAACPCPPVVMETENLETTLSRTSVFFVLQDRSAVFQQFSESGSGVLLCTDVAARGLDLPQVTWIVQYTPPTSAAEYVHRVGRTARIGGRGSSLLFLTPAETAFISELANHSFSLSEMKLHDILSSLMMDDTFKGRGKYHSKTWSRALEQEVRERATVLQTHFENFVHSSTNALQMAKKALQSFIRSYTTYPAHLKHAFHIRSLHLGHAAKSFGLRDAPTSLTSATGSTGNKQSRNQTRNQTAGPVGPKRFAVGQTECGWLCSEFSSGLDKDKVQKKKKKKKMFSQRGQEQDAVTSGGL
ncbi:probable ATP-dependent RNA helicase DDX31 [Thalassophryne amazonica]|uniref:probable ATP-dependent RNA helicase DDX31 n=1 Tax=Thalassophryne amazonica TaxID=390379 RepID=UPI001470D44B|nr:probable ATP-dependent RNA helicase DDX31 [Thalassophryne amazonica]